MIPIFDKKKGPLVEKLINKLKEMKKRFGNNGRNNWAMKAQREGISMRSKEWNTLIHE